MARKRTTFATGTLVVLEHDSRVLAGNPLGDPHVRKVAVWLPPQYDEGATRGRGRRLPVLYDLVGFTGSGLAHAGWKPFGDNVPERVAEPRVPRQPLVEAKLVAALRPHQPDEAPFGDRGPAREVRHEGDQR